ncbi:hypothetical protein K504DRAFT_508072 [Pleomassaria siparia CBS 279.74]|uniref:Uncharacterized protein n=1 Tax=Pleomassaria siparia CBS 279.74 TaxID=1314801 RepID=A0A6G1JTL2_9PLEO|nr:hypothetical protein K504DRAFT_508072 [Pleomassaria siparia CBS 279.74]
MTAPLARVPSTSWFERGSASCIQIRIGRRLDKLTKDMNARRGRTRQTCSRPVELTVGVAPANTTKTLNFLPTRLDSSCQPSPSLWRRVPGPDIRDEAKPSRSSQAYLDLPLLVLDAYDSNPAAFGLTKTSRGTILHGNRQASSVRRQSVKRQASGVRRQVSSVKRQASSFKRQASNFKLQTSRSL